MRAHKRKACCSLSRHQRQHQPQRQDQPQHQTNPNAKTNRNTNPTTIVVAFPDAQTDTKSVTNTHSKFFADPVEANAIGYLRCEDVSSRRDRRPMRS